jgi:prepilin-type N-terminal cleavage/methylation domain-containing protein
MKLFSKYRKNTGVTLIEVIVASAIISVAIFALMSGAQKGITASNDALKAMQASMLLEEGAEAVKTIRDNAWGNISSLTNDTTYYLSYNTGTNAWSLSTTPASAIDGVFTRTVVFSAVSRDSADDIVSSGGTLDSRTRKVTVTATWPNSPAVTVSKTLIFYISDIFT